MIDACMSIKPVPLCYRCQSPMEVRTRRQEPNAGTRFLGCSSWPTTKCDFTLSLLGEGSEGEDAGRAFSVLSEEEFYARLPQPTQRGRISRAKAKLFEWLHKMHRRRLESDEPDATGAWEPKHRRSVVRCVHDRDGGRCGLCGAKMKIKGAHVEHIAPKILPTFNINGERAVSGNQFKSVLHKLDNLQAAHSYCNKPKGNSPDMGRWRHPDMPPLVIAMTDAGSRLVIPAVAEGVFLDDGPIPTKRALQRWALVLSGLMVWLLGSLLLLRWWFDPAGEEIQAALLDWMRQLLNG